MNIKIYLIVYFFYNSLYSWKSENIFKCLSSKNSDNEKSWEKKVVLYNKRVLVEPVKIIIYDYYYIFFLA